jgi:hypothetical protein
MVSMAVPRSFVALSGVVALLAVAARARAEDTKRECMASSDQAQALRAHGQLVEARERLLACTRQDCPTLIVQDCDQWLAEVQRSLPTIVFAASDAAGHDMDDVRVTLEDRVLRERLDGRPVAVDPGKYQIRFQHDGATVALDLIVREGEKDRLVAVTFAAAAVAATTSPPAPGAPLSSDQPTPPPSPSHGTSTATWVFGGVGVAGLAVAGAFGVAAAVDYSNAYASCGSSGCPQWRLDRISTERTAGWVSLGVGLVSLGISAVLFFARF